MYIPLGNFHLPTGDIKMKSGISKTAFAFLLSGLIIVTTPAYAGSKALDALLKVMQENGQISAAQYQMILDVAKAEEAETSVQTIAETKAIVKEEAQAIVKQETKDTIKINTKGKLEITSEDENFKFRLGGRIMLDGAIYDEDKTPLGNQAEVRRARLYMNGTLWKVWQFKTQFDFAGNGVSTKDLYLKYTGFKPATITVGNFKEPFSLEGLTSSKYSTFIERNISDTLVPQRNLGIGINTNGSNWSAAAGLFADGIDDNEPTGVDESYAITGRVTFAPILDDSRVLHFGASASHRNLHDGNNNLKLETRPEAHTSDQKLISTGTMANIDSFNRYNLEAAWVKGPFSLQGQYIKMDVSRDSGSDDLDFDAYYLEASWFLTGESRVYKHKNGTFSYPKIKKIAGLGGIGAWQIAVRFSSLDLTDGSVIGGEEQNATLGLNWYATPNMRFMANYTKVLDVDRPGNIHDGDEPSIFQVRAQVHW